MQIRNNIRLSIILMLGDISVINAGFLFSYWLRFNSGFFKIVHGTPHFSQYLQILPLLTIILIFLMRSDRLYSTRARLSIVDEFFTIVKTVTIGIIVFMVATFFYREYSFSRGMLFIAWFILILFLGGWRFFVNRIRFALRRRVEKNRNLLLIGNSMMCGRLIRHISGDPHWDYNVKGIVSTNGNVLENIEGVPFLGSLENLPDILSKEDIDEVILTEIDLPRVKIMDTIMECEKRMVEFRLIADLLGMVTSQVDMRTIDGIPLLGLKESPLSEGYNRFIKRMMDLVLSACGIAVLSPLFLVVAALIKMTSPGPVFYVQKRLGEDGRRFNMLKFRTMAEVKEFDKSRVWTAEDDPRRTKFGTFLRKTNLDELPQLINVFRGEMSLVGPRPERPHFVRKFKNDIPRYMARHKIKSGMTGWAQVNGLRGNTSIEERTKYDLYYIENWSLTFELRIILMSIFAMKNAY